jgi:hypothetical protein
MYGISYILGHIERICKVEAINDCPFLQDFEIIVLEISRNLFLHSSTVRIKQKECTIVVEVLYRKGHHDLEKFWMECVPGGNLRRWIGQPRNWKTIWIFGNDQVDCCTLLHLTLEIELTALTSLRQNSIIKGYSNIYNR